MTFTELAVLAQRDPRWQDHHVRANAPLIRHCVARWGRGLDDDEAEQVARIACIQALNTFDPALGTWGTHARVRIRAELARARHDCHVVSGLRRRGGSCTQEREERREAARHAASLDLVLPNGDTFGDLFAADAATPEEHAEERELAGERARFVERLMRRSRLSPREDLALRCRMRGESQVVIARRLGVSRQRIEQLESHAVAKLSRTVRRYRIKEVA